MRAFSAVIVLLFANATSAQTVNTVQNGDWNSPSTWSCNCVPAPNSSLVIMHSVQLLGDLNMLYPQVQVTSTGEIMTTFPVNVVNDGNFIMEGHVFFQGSFANLDLVDIVGYFEVAGTFFTDGQLVMDGGTLQVEGDFTNSSNVSGQGSICVYDVTTNEGTITGTVDMCDFTPTTTVSPIVDINSGTIAPTVTYCTNSTCSTGIGQMVLAQVNIAQDMAGDRVFVTGLPVGASIAIIDGSGRTCITRSITADRTEIGISLLADGLYRVAVRTEGALRAMSLVIAR